MSSNEDDGLRAFFSLIQDNSSGELLAAAGLQDRSFYIPSLPTKNSTLDLVALVSTSDRGRPCLPTRGKVDRGETDKAERASAQYHSAPRARPQALHSQNEVIEIPDGKKDFLYYSD